MSHYMVPEPRLLLGGWDAPAVPKNFTNAVDFSQQKFKILQASTNWYSRNNFDLGQLKHLPFS